MKVLVLRKCTEGRKSHGDRFQYPKTGIVEAKDWDGKPECGGGLHGLLWGSGSFPIHDYGSIWQVIEVEKKDIIEFDEKCKFKKGNVLLTTKSQLNAVNLLKGHHNYPKDNILNYDINDKQYAVSGYESTQTAGYESTQTAGDESTQKAGYRSMQTAGYGSTQTAGYGSTQKAGNRSMQTAGPNSIQIGFWYDKEKKYHVAHRKVTKSIANKPYYFQGGKWALVKEDGSK